VRDDTLRGIGKEPAESVENSKLELHHLRRRGVVYHDTLELGQLKDAIGKKRKGKFPHQIPSPLYEDPTTASRQRFQDRLRRSRREGGMEDAEVGDAEARDAGDGERERATLRRRRARKSRRQSTDGGLMGEMGTTTVRPVELVDTEMHKTGMEDADVDNAGVITGDAEARDAGDGERERATLQRSRARMSRTRVQEARRSRVVVAPGESTTQVVNVGGRLSRMDANEIEDHLCRGEMELDIMYIEVRGPGPRPGATREELRRRSAVLTEGCI